jgi:hypothetical protein
VCGPNRGELVKNKEKAMIFQITCMALLSAAGEMHSFGEKQEVYIQLQQETCWKTDVMLKWS